MLLELSGDLLRDWIFIVDGEKKTDGAAGKKSVQVSGIAKRKTIGKRERFEKCNLVAVYLPFFLEHNFHFSPQHFCYY